MGQRLVKTLWRLFSTGGAIVGPNFESGKNPFNSGMDHVRALKGQGLMITVLLGFLELNNENEKNNY